MASDTIPGAVALRDELRRQRVFNDLVRLQFDQAPVGIAVTAANGLIVTLAMSHFFPTGLAWLWYLGLLAILAARVFLVLGYRAKETALAVRAWSRLFTAGAAATGLAWGLSVYALPWASFNDEVFLSFVIAGMVAGAIPSLSPCLSTYVLYMLGALLPVAVRMAIISGNFALTFLLLITLFGLFMFVTAKAHHTTVRRSLELRYANEDLVADLTEESARAKALNAKLTDEVHRRASMEQALLIAKEQAEAANGAKSEFVANMSHEIRTPMNGVLGMIELLSQSKLDQQQSSYLELARTSSESLLNVINAILDFSKIEANKLELESVPFDVRSIAEDVTALFSANAQSSDLELTCFVAPQIHTRVLGDSTRLRQILTNLLGNAVKFTRNGEVSLHVQELALNAQRIILGFEIRDSGIGMTPEQTARLFEPFRQADGSMTRRFGGSGLGLAITKRLTELMGGEITLESEYGVGTVFRVRIPFTRQQHSEALAPDAGLDGKRVLAVDDHATNRKILAHYLRGWGVAVATAASAQECLSLMRSAAAEERPFEAVLLDMQMPDMDGQALARSIKSEPALASAALILLSSPGDSAVSDLTESGIALMLAKPVRHGMLRDALFQVIYGVTPEYAVSDDGPAQNGPKLRGRVLLAEDNPVNQRVAKSMLERMGVDVDVVENGALALERSAAQAYDAILMDVQMPVMDGLSAVRALREREQASGSMRIPVIAMTANAMAGDRDECLGAGMDDYVPKPFKSRQLRDALARWLTQDRAQA
jgi:signal transduction histidine kinase/DNA-binding response OmpR family regulator